MRLFYRALVLIAPLALLAACATAPVGPPVASPRFVVGDHWQYRVIDNMRRGAVSQIDAEVVALAGDVATLRIVKLDGGMRSEWTDEIEGGGGLRAGMLDDSASRRFTPAAALLAFPLEQGKTWRQDRPDLSPRYPAARPDPDLRRRAGPRAGHRAGRQLRRHPDLSCPPVR